MRDTAQLHCFSVKQPWNQTEARRDSIDHHRLRQCVPSDAMSSSRRGFSSVFQLLCCCSEYFLTSASKARIFLPSSTSSGLITRQSGSIVSPPVEEEEVAIAEALPNTVLMLLRMDERENALCSLGDCLLLLLLLEEEELAVWMTGVFMGPGS